MAYRQTNHNGRVSTKSGSVYNRNHNDRSFDISHAENVHPNMVSENIIIHYDETNHPHVIDIKDRSHTTIDEHEHHIYESLFAESLSKQHARNEAARHPERNKSIDDLLNSKNTCPEETIFQIGSTEDGYPPVEVLMAIFEDYQKELIDIYGHNLHFLDVALHMDEAVPHLHIRKVWTYDGKDGLDISQNKALAEMGFERPDTNKPSNKWNNAKISFSEWERDMKLRICEKHGVTVAHTPKVPGKISMEKEEAIAIKLQEKIASLNAELVSEEEKNKVVPDTNIFGKPKQISVTPEEYRRWQASAETRENNERMQKYLKEQQALLDKREKALNKQGRDLADRHLMIESEVSQRVEEGIKEKLPSTIKQLQYELKVERKQLEQQKTSLDLRSEKLDKIAENLHNHETYLKDVSSKLEVRKNNLDAEVKKSVAAIIKDTFRDFFQKFKDSFLKHFKGKHQEDVLEVIKDMPIDEETADRLFRYGFYDAERHTIGEILERALEEDIKDAIHEAGASYKQIKMDDIEAVKKNIRKNSSLDDTICIIATEISKRLATSKKR